MTNRIFTFVVWALAALIPTAAPAMPSVDKFNEHTGVKRHFQTALSGVKALTGGLVSAFANAINAPLRASGFALNAGSLNTFLNPLPTVPFQAAEFTADMPRGLFIEELYCVISGTLTVAGGSADGTLQTENIARLIDQMRIRWDGTDLYGPVSGRDAVAISRYLTSQQLTSDDVTSAGVQTGTTFKQAFKVPFNRKYLADPFDTVLPPLAVGSEFVVKVKWNQAVAGGVSTAGTGAFISGGDRACTLSDVQLTITPRVARDGKAPYMIPIISTYDSEQFNAANQKLTLRMNSPLPFDSALLRTYENAAENPVDLIRDATFKTDLSRIYDSVPLDTLRAISEDQFPAYTQASAPGEAMMLFADGGKLGNVVDPAHLTNPQFQFNVSAPGTNPGFVRAIVMELMSIPNVTRF